MAKAATKLKLAAPEVPAPQSIEEVNDAIARIGAAQRERTRIEADMNDQIAAIKEEFEVKAEPYKDEITQLAKGVQIYCDANRLKLTDGGKVKYVKLPSGEINWRMGMPTVKTKKGLSVDTILELLKSMGKTGLIRTREELDKEAILRDPDAIANIREIEIVQKESFGITPFETKLELVTT